MISRTTKGEPGVESASQPPLTGWKRKAKVTYYKFFIRLYAISLLFADRIVTNSSWTYAHIVKILSLGRSTLIAKWFLSKVGTSDCTTVFPPCDTTEFLSYPLDSPNRQSLTLISLAQFRPEKDHAMQILALEMLLNEHPEYRKTKIKLVLMGSCRDQEDTDRVETLRRLARDCHVESHVEFVVNASFAEIKARLGTASIGLNTMKDEHFGISVVEFMASGLIPVVHASAGPLLDIVTPFKGQITGERLFNYHLSSNH